MAVKIGSNIESQKGVRQLSRATDALSSVNERLSSGQRINHASDDAAGLAIASSLNAKARVYTVAQRNVSDTISAVSIASDAVSALTEITTRQKELAEQSANGTYSTKQRTALDKESRELTNEYNRIVSTTQFNGIKLLDNPWDTLSTQLGIGNQASIGFKFADELSTKLTPGGYFLLGNGTGQTSVWFTIDGQGTNPQASNSSIRVDLSSAPVSVAATPPSFSFSTTDGASLNTHGGPGSYVTVNLPSISSSTYFWFDVTGGGGSYDPDPFSTGGGGGYGVAVNNNDSAQQVAQALGSAITAATGGAINVNVSSNNITLTDMVAGAFYGPSIAGDTAFNMNFSLNGSNAYSQPGLTREAIALSVLTALNASGQFNASLGNSAGELTVQNINTGTVVGTQDVNTGIVLTDTISPGTGAQSYGFSSSTNDSAQLADLDGNGTLDIISGASNDLNIFLNQGNGTFDVRHSYPIGSAIHSPQVVDLNGDGRPDIVSADYSSSSLSVLINNGDGTFGPRASYGVGSSPGGVQLADLNGDGKLDIATTDAGSNTVSVLFNRGDGTFSPRASFGVGVNPIGDPVLVDINADGHPDIVASNYTSNTVSVLMNLGNGSFGASMSYAVGTNPRSTPALADLNGDGRPDIVTSDSGSSSLSVLLNNGNGTFGPKTSYSVGSTQFGVTVADFNGDGRADLATSDGSSGTLSVLLNTGAGSFGTRVSYALAGAAFGKPTAVDIDGDGRLDLSAQTGNGISVFRNLGNGTFSSETTYRALGSLFTASPQFGDLNGDGKLDIVDTGSSNVSIFTNQGNGSFGSFAGTTGSQRLIFGDGRGMTEINQIDLSTQFLAKKAMPVLDARLERLGKQQGAFGAVQSRLQTASRVLSTTTLNYRNAESRIMDTDIAQDAAEQTRLTIIQRAAASVLAQANLQPEIALKLLKL